MVLVAFDYRPAMVLQAAFNKFWTLNYGSNFLELDTYL